MFCSRKGKRMILNTQIVREYLRGDNLARHRGDWVYQNFENVQSRDGSMFTEPDSSDDTLSFSFDKMSLKVFLSIL